MSIFKTTILLALSLVTITLVNGCGEKESGLKNSSEAQALKVYKKAPSFTAENFDGRTFKSEDLEGKVWIGSLFFTNCNGPCPVLTSNLAVLKAANNDNADAAFVSISVDPVNDTGEVLKNYAERHGAEPGGNWYFVRMPQDSFKTVIREGLMLNAEGNPAMHSTHFFLVDRKGDLRGFYEGTDQKRVADLSRDFKTLLTNN